MSYVSFISFPRKLKKYPFLDFKHRLDELYKLYPHFRHNNESTCLYSPPDASFKNGYISIFENNSAHFEESFKNQFVYEYDVNVVDNFTEEKLEIINKYSNKDLLSAESNIDVMNNELKKYWDILERQSLRVLHEFINNNLAIGEISEICTALLYTDSHGVSPEICYFPPPKSSYNINLCDLLVTPLPSVALKQGESYKISIRKAMP